MATEMVRKNQTQGHAAKMWVLVVAIARVLTDSGDFITKLHHHEEEFIKNLWSTGSQNFLPEQPCASTLQAECDVCQKEVNNLE